MTKRFLYLLLVPFWLSLSATAYADGDGPTVLSLSEAKFIVSAHRGGPMPGLPENAIETLAWHSENTGGPMVFELDVRQIADGSFILMHDHTLERTTTGAGLVKDMSAADLKDIRLKDNDGKVTPYKIPTLKAMLRWADGKAVLMLDVKRGISSTKLSAVIKDEGASDRVFIINYNFRDARTFARLLPKAGLSASADNAQELAALKALHLPRKQTWIWSGFDDLKPDYYKAAKEVAAHVQRGTFGRIDNQAKASGSALIYTRILTSGVTVIATDNPTIAVKAKALK